MATHYTYRFRRISSHVLSRTLRKISEHAVLFQSHLDGQKYELSPERFGIEIQNLLGSDIQMQLDECIKLPATEADIRKCNATQFKMGGKISAESLKNLGGRSQRTRPVWNRSRW